MKPLVRASQSETFVFPGSRDPVTPQSVIFHDQPCSIPLPPNLLYVYPPRPHSTPSSHLTHYSVCVSMLEGCRESLCISNSYIMMSILLAGILAGGVTNGFSRLDPRPPNFHTIPTTERLMEWIGLAARVLKCTQVMPTSTYSDPRGTPLWSATGSGLTDTRLECRRRHVSGTQLFD
ncbi:hypothetical protein DPEC_G00276030 [Dallia pectoralis]|uniref:Uncharacterized protein n=1 Tax=Dallia pectoralis TaxID=75939 RepID=A0ACC2FLG3_DALPE|nr:hypothetical protein DPEC_G00276030 [Dallia pectoralis]